MNNYRNEMAHSYVSMAPIPPGTEPGVMDPAVVAQMFEQITSYRTNRNQRTATLVEEATLRAQIDLIEPAWQMASRFTWAMSWRSTARDLVSTLEQMEDAHPVIPRLNAATGSTGSQ